MESENYILTYYQGIMDGSIVVGKWIRLVYERIIAMIESKEAYFNQKEANMAIEWIEKHAFHTEGPLAPQPLKLELWQKAMLSCLYGVYNTESQKRQFRECALIVGRKNGKSALCSALAKYTMYVDGGDYGSRVFCLAPKLDQADIIYNSVWQMIQLDPEWQALKQAVQDSKDAHNMKTLDDSMLARHRQSDLYIPGMNSQVKKIPFSSRRSDGFNPNLTICDEIASWEGDKGLKQYEVMKSAMGAREMGGRPAILLSCSTAGYVSDSIYDELIARSTRFLNGESKETKLLPFLYMIDDVEKWNDVNELRKSNPNLGVSVSISYLLEEIAIAEGSLSKKREFITKYCNIKQNSSMAFFPAEIVNKCFGSKLSLKDFRKSYTCLGIDLSQVRDLTACTTLLERDGELYADVHFWIPGGKMEEAIARDGVPYDIYMRQGFLSPSGDAFIDYQDCYNWVCDLVEKYEILPLMIGYDRYSAQYLIQDLENTGGRLTGFHCDDVYQGDNLWGCLTELYSMAEEGRVHILGNENGDDNHLMKMHMLDSAVKMSVERGRGKLVKVSAQSHVDGVASLLDSMAVRSKHYDRLGGQLKNERR